MNIYDNFSAFDKFKRANGLTIRSAGTVSKYIAWSTLEKKIKSAYAECREDILKHFHMRKSKLTNRVITTLAELNLVFEKFLAALSNKNSIDAWNKFIKKVEEADYETMIIAGMSQYVKEK